MSVGDAALSRGNIMRRLADLEDRLDRLTTARRLEAASIGAGGLRIQGGHLLAQDGAGGKVFEVTTEPASIFMRQELIKQLVKELMAEAITEADGFGTNTFDTDNVWEEYIDVSTSQPVVASNVDVAAGRCLVIMSATLTARPPAGETGSIRMSYGITGPGGFNRDPGSKKVAIGRAAADVSETVEHPTADLSRMSIEFGMPAGLYDFKLYGLWNNSVGEGTVQSPSIAVVPF